MATENFKLGVVAATGGIALLYLLSFVLGFFGVSVPLIHSSGMFGILFSVFVVVVAALNLVLDFDFIETGVERGAPKHMEWYGAFGLLVTLVWLCHGSIHQRRWILYQIFREPTPLRLTIVPAGVPHWFTDIQGSITQMALHLPDHSAGEVEAEAPKP